MDNPDKLARYGTQDTIRRQTKQKHNTVCVEQPKKKSFDYTLLVSHFKYNITVNKILKN
jgi:hypothetical protein